MEAGNSDQKPGSGGGNGSSPRSARQDRRAQHAQTRQALHKAFGNGDGDGRQRTTAARRPSDQDEADTRSNRLVSEAVMAGLDSVSAAHAHDRVPVGARSGSGGGGLPDAPSEEDRESHDDEGGLPEDVDTETRIAAMPPVEDDDELDAAIAHREPKPHPLIAFGATLNRFVGEAGEMTALGGQIFKSGVVHPKGYWGDVKDQIYEGMKLCWLPMIFAVMCFGFGAPGLQGGNILTLFGVPDRLGGFFMFASIREFAPFVEAMVVAGVVGTAITADLGARRIREEIDAMEVLGVDPVRKLMLPRVISTTILTAFFDLFALLLGIVSGFFAGLFLGSSQSGFVASFFSQSNISDDWGSFVKSAVFGLIIGMVCSYKGYRAKGGPAGVGRAVNQAVVVSFALIWVVDYAFTNLLLGYAPSTQVIK